MTAETSRSPALAMLDGSGLSCEKVRTIARDGEPVAVAEAGLERARRARDAVHAVTATRPVYGRTTGVGANGAAVKATPYAVVPVTGPKLEFRP